MSERPMVRRVCALLLILMVVGIAVPSPQVEAHGGWWTATLRIWGDIGPVPENKPLLLAPAEDYRLYAFSLEATEGVPASGYVIVRHVLTGDIICEGPLVDVEGVHVYRYCNDLRVEHHYTVQIVATTPGDLYLYAVA